MFELIIGIMYLLVITSMFIIAFSKENTKSQRIFYGILGIAFILAIIKRW